MNPQIFREYDIRGLVKEDLAPENVELIGKAIGTYIRRDGGKTLTLGWDVRTSSVEFRDIMTRALNSTGCDGSLFFPAPSETRRRRDDHRKS
jgi:phosphomannomutase/phosphoglucomutase